MTKSEEIKKWDFFCREVAKANDTLNIIDKTWHHINLNQNAYNEYFALIIDALTTKVFLHLGHLFDTQDDSLRLTRIITDPAHQKRLQELKLEAAPFLEYRHKQHAHLSRVKTEINYDSNFRLMDERSLIKISEILTEVSKLLRQWGINHNEGNIVADRWGNIATSTDILFEHLTEYELIRSKMSTVEHVKLVEEIRKNKELVSRSKLS